MHFNGFKTSDNKIKCSHMYKQSVKEFRFMYFLQIWPTSYVMVSHGDLRDDVCALSEACLHEAVVFLQRLFDHLQLGVHVCHEEILHPAVRQRQGLQLGTQNRPCFSVHATGFLHIFHFKIPQIPKPLGRFSDHI